MHKHDGTVNSIQTNEESRSSKEDMQKGVRRALGNKINIESSMVAAFSGSAQR